MEIRIPTNPSFHPLPVFTYQESRDLDLYTQGEWGIEGKTLMGVAAKSFLETYRDFLNRENSICIFAGKGNNGGDGYALAYFLACEEIPFAVYEMIESGHTEFAGYYRNLLMKILQIYPSLGRIRSLKEFSISDGYQFSVFVDCILGTGARKESSEEFRFLERILAHIQKAQMSPLIALDHPSFDESLEYESLGEIGCFKWENLHIPRKRKRLVSIGFPIPVYANQVFSQQVSYFPSPAEPYPYFQKNASHKYDAGSCVFLGGSQGMEGAILLSSAAFMGFGGGICKIFFHSSLGPEILLSRDPSFMGVVWKEDSPKDPFLEKVPVLVWGPGTFPYKDFSSLSSWIRTWLEESKKRYSIWDGGAIPSYGQWNASSFHERVLLTPHSGEFKRLTGLSHTPSIQESAMLARNFCLENQTNLFLKSNPSVFVNFKGRMYVWDYENPRLATMGTGDLLTGTMGILLAKGFSFEGSIYIALSLFSKVTEMEQISPTAWEILAFLKMYLYSTIRK